MLGAARACIYNHSELQSLRTVKRTVNPRSLRNLRPFRKGHSGNPGGRPKNVISEATREWLKLIDRRTGKTNAELIAQALGRKARKGDTGAYCALRDTTEGRPPQTQQHEIISSSPLKVRIDAPDLMAALRQIYGLAKSDFSDPNKSQPTEPRE